MNQRKKQTFFHILMILILIAALLLMIRLLMEEKHVTEFIENTIEHFEPKPKETEQPFTEGALPDGSSYLNVNLSEQNVYSFLQGPMAWSSKAPWSGSWCDMGLAGSTFGVFGCGLCDLANIYSTLTPYECSPIDMYYYAQEVSSYSPNSGVRAIDWPFLQQTLESAGFTCSLGSKDETYDQFCASIQSAQTAIVLVSSYNDNSFWPTTEGHYVNIWMYNSDTDKVFLSDSGSSERNRRWIPLSTVYSALKTNSGYQYLLVHSYDEEKNSWKHSGIDIEWTAPEYYTPKTP